MKVPLKIVRAFLLLVLSLWSRMAQAEVIKIAIPSTTQAVLPFTIARDKGYYRAEGLDVELILMSAPIASRALLSGDVTVATVGGAGLPPVLWFAVQVPVYDLQPRDVLALREAGNTRLERVEK